jgi:uncharacterized 2Fe-2S/4Fe-4S cluster protein (DUF4445 family)
MKITVDIEGEKVGIERGQSLLEAIRITRLRITSPCGGKGTCGKCLVKIEPGDSPGEPTPAEMELLETEDIGQGYRLACQTFPDKDIRIEVPEESREVTLELLLKHATIKEIEEPALTVQTRKLTASEKPASFASDKGALWFDGGKIAAVTEESAKRIGVALDIGSTTMVVYAFDIEHQKIVSAEAMTNPQRSFGEDIMTRIDLAMKGPEKKAQLEKVLRNGVSELVRNLTEKIGCKPEDILRLTFVGNTAMHHFFLGLDVTKLGRVPFQPERKEAIEVMGSDIGLKGLEKVKVNSPPLIAGYVGADHVGVLLATNLLDQKAPTAAIDIGTNAEIGLSIGGKIVCCSAAAGPAFEGGNISHGMRATKGAIFRVWSEAGALKYETIKNEEPVGLCGSGLIDFVSEGLRLGLIDSAGTYVRDNCGDRMMGKHGNARYLLYSNGRREVSISQGDIRQLQLGKAAIHSGLEIMMDKMKLAEIDRLLLAGAFGANMSIRNGRFIGMFPEIPLNRIDPVGNAAGTGAIQLLTDMRARKKVEEIIRKTSHIELSSEKDFQKRFIAALDFPHQDVTKYPESSKSVKIRVERRK